MRRGAITSLAIGAAILVAASAAAAQPLCPTQNADVRIELDVPRPAIDKLCRSPHCKASPACTITADERWGSTGLN